MLLAAIVGSGIMAETLSQGNVSLAPLGNTIASGQRQLRPTTTIDDEGAASAAKALRRCCAQVFGRAVFNFYGRLKRCCVTLRGEGLARSLVPQPFEKARKGWGSVRLLIKS
jgi:hypothetical protein